MKVVLWLRKQVEVLELRVSQVAQVNPTTRDRLSTPKNLDAKYHNELLSSKPDGERRVAFLRVSSSSKP